MYHRALLLDVLDIRLVCPMCNLCYFLQCSDNSFHRVESEDFCDLCSALIGISTFCFGHDPRFETDSQVAIAGKWLCFIRADLI